MKGGIMSWLKRWWRHQMETFSALLVLCVGIHPSPVNSHLKGQRCGALMISLMYARTNGWAYNRDAGDLRLNCAHYDIHVMIINITIGIIMIMMIRSRHKFAHVMPAQLSCTTAQLLWHVCARRNNNVKTTSFWRYFWVVCPLGPGPFDTKTITTAWEITICSFTVRERTVALKIIAPKLPPESETLTTLLIKAGHKTDFTHAILIKIWLQVYVLKCYVACLNDNFQVQWLNGNNRGIGTLCSEIKREIFAKSDKTRLLP